MRHRSLRTLRLRNCTLDVDDFAFVYHLEGLETLELMNARSELLLANSPAWSNLPRQMPTLRALHIEALENLTDDAVLSCIADGMSENSAFKSLELNSRYIDATTVHFFVSMGPLLQRLGGTSCLERLQWSVTNAAFISDALASGSNLQHLHLGFLGTHASPFDEWYEPLFRSLRCCRRLESVQLEHEDDNTNDKCYTSLRLGNCFGEWLGSSTTLQSLPMHGYSFNRCFLANAGTAVLRSSSLVSICFRNTQFDDLSVFGQALVEGATIQKFQLSREALSDEFLLQLARMPHLMSLTVQGKLDDRLGLLVEAVRSNTTLEHIHTVPEHDSEEGPDEVVQSRATMELYLTLNRYGRRFLNTHQLPPGLWAKVLAKASANAKHAVLFHFLRSMPSLVRLRRGVSRNRPSRLIE